MALPFSFSCVCVCFDFGRRLGCFDGFGMGGEFRGTRLRFSGFRVGGFREFGE